MTVPLRPVSSGRLLLRLPADDLEVEVSGAPGGWRCGPLSPLPLGEGRVRAPGEGRVQGNLSLPSPSGRGQGEGNLSLPSPSGRGQGEGTYSPLPLGEGRVRATYRSALPKGQGAASWSASRSATPANWASAGSRGASRRGEGQLVSVDQTLLAEVLDSGVHFNGTFRYRIQRGAVEKLRLRIPPGMAIEDVRGTEVADWSIETLPAAGPRPESQQLVVALKAELTGDTELAVQSVPPRSGAVPGHRHRRPRAARCRA